MPLDVGATFITNHQAAKAMQPREIALGNPPIATKPFAGFDVFACDAGRDAACAQALHVFARTVPEVGMHLTRTPSRAATATSHGHNAVDHHQERNDVGHVGAVRAGIGGRAARPLRAANHAGASSRSPRCTLAPAAGPPTESRCARQTRCPSMRPDLTSADAHAVIGARASPAAVR